MGKGLRTGRRRRARRGRHVTLLRPDERVHYPVRAPKRPQLVPHRRLLPQPGELGLHVGLEEVFLGHDARALFVPVRRLLLLLSRVFESLQEERRTRAVPPGLPGCASGGSAVSSRRAAFLPGREAVRLVARGAAAAKGAEEGEEGG